MDRSDVVSDFEQSALQQPRAGMQGEKRLRVGVLTNRNLHSPWASTHYYASQALIREGVSFRHVGGEYLETFYQRKGPSLLSRWFKPRRLADSFDEFQKVIESDLARHDYDVILAMHSSQYVAALETARCPVVYMADATADLLQGYYPNRSDISEAEVARHHEAECRTIQLAEALIVPTRWVANSAIDHYHAPAEKVHVVEWGANLEPGAGLTLDNVQGAPVPRPDQPVNLLFVGLDWYRKGGDVAVQAVQRLRNQGLDARLTVVGADIPAADRSPHVVSLGRLNRAVRKQAALLDEQLGKAHFLVHPAKAECFGHVLCEALAFGAPVIASDTGGISQCVSEGVTGILLPTGSPPEGYATAIAGLVSDSTRYQRMRDNGVRDFTERLNWGRWAQGFMAVVQSMHENV